MLIPPPFQASSLGRFENCNRRNFPALLLPTIDVLGFTHGYAFVLCAVKPTEVLKMLFYLRSKSHWDLNTNEMAAEKLKKFAKF